MSSTDTLFGKLRVEDVPAPDAMPFEALGVVGTVETREVANGKVMVTIPLTYRRDGQVDDRTFYARLFVVPAWFDPTFDPATLEPNDRTNYNITMKQKVRGLFIAAGVKEGGIGRASWRERGEMWVGLEFRRALFRSRSTRPRWNPMTGRTTTSP